MRCNTLPALSIRQPWAYAILHLGKDVENRSRRLNYRGPLLIHAAKRFANCDWLDAVSWIDANVKDQRLRLPDANWSWPRGGIVGIADLVDCVERSKSKWFAGPYGLVLKHARPLDFTPYKGRLGMFHVPRGAISLRTE